MSDSDSGNIALVSPPVRGRPFQKGNPGKPKGARAHANRFLDHITAGDMREIIAVTVERAKKGHTPSIEILLSRLLPVPVGRRVSFDWPTGLSAEGIGTAFDAVMAGIGDGKLTPDEGLQIANILKMKAAILDTHEIQQQIAELRTAIEKLQTKQ